MYCSELQGYTVWIYSAMYSAVYSAIYGADMRCDIQCGICSAIYGADMRCDIQCGMTTQCDVRYNDTVRRCSTTCDATCGVMRYDDAVRRAVRQCRKRLRFFGIYYPPTIRTCSGHN